MVHERANISIGTVRSATFSLEVARYTLAHVVVKINFAALDYSENTEKRKIPRHYSQLFSLAQT